MFNKTFEKSIKKVLFKNNHTREIKLDIKKVILLEDFSTMDLFWNSYLVENITKAGKKITVQVNSSTLAVIHKTKVFGYKQHVWFSKDAYNQHNFSQKLD